MALAYRTKTEDETQASVGNAGLVRVRNDAGIEERRSLECVFLEEVCADQPPLGRGKGAMAVDHDVHLRRPRIAAFGKVAMTALEALKRGAQPLLRPGIIERQNPVDDVVGAVEVGGIVIERLSGRLEISEDHAPCIGMQGERLTLKKLRQAFGLGQDRLISSGDARSG